MSGPVSAAPRSDDQSRRPSIPDDETVTVPVLLDRAQKVQRDQVRAILQNRPSGDLAPDGASAQQGGFDPSPETTGPDVIEI